MKANTTVIGDGGGGCLDGDPGTTCIEGWPQKGTTSI